MTRPIRVATINHNDDDIGSRVRLELHKAGREYVWSSADGDCGLPPFNTVRDAEIGAIHAWGAGCWDLRARWHWDGPAAHGMRCS